MGQSFGCGGCDKYELCGKAQKNFTQALLVTVLTNFTYGTILKETKKHPVMIPLNTKSFFSNFILTMT